MKLYEVLLILVVVQVTQPSKAELLKTKLIAIKIEREGSTEVERWEKKTTP
jgi:hypothetical protein